MPGIKKTFHAKNSTRFITLKSAINQQSTTIFTHPTSFYFATIKIALLLCRRSKHRTPLPKPRGTGLVSGRISRMCASRMKINSFPKRSFANINGFPLDHHLAWKIGFCVETAKHNAINGIQQEFTKFCLDNLFAHKEASLLTDTGQDNIKSVLLLARPSVI